MAGLGTTPGRTTTVTLDTPIYTTEYKTWAASRKGIDIAEPTGEGVVDAAFIPSIGWQIRPFQSDQYYAYERNTADAQVITPGNSNATVATGILELKAQRHLSELTGVPAGDQRSSGFPMLSKTVAAGTSWADVTLAADALAFPGPDTANSLVPLDRVLVSTADHLPTEQIHWVISVGELSGVHMLQRIGGLHFSGIPTYTQQDKNAGFKGLGQYDLILRADGKAELWEQRIKLVPDAPITTATNYDWVRRKRLRWAHPGQVSGRAHVVTITSDASRGILHPDKFSGTVISFEFNEWHSITYEILAEVVKRVLGRGAQQYACTQIERIDGQPERLRLDVRRDLASARIQISKSFYRTTATIRTKTVTLDQIPGASGPEIRFEWSGRVPSGTAISAALYQKDGTALSAGTGGTGAYGSAGWAHFTVPTGKNEFYAVVTLSASGDQLQTPTLTECRWVLNGTTILTAPTPIDIRTVERVSITGPSGDPSSESLGIRAQDVRGELDNIESRSGMPVMVKVGYNPADDTQYTILFRGFVHTAKGSKKGATRARGAGQITANTYGQNWRQYDIRAMGEWQRLSQAKTAFSRSFATDIVSLTATPSKTEAMRITEAVRILLGEAGYPSTMIDIPDKEMRFLNQPNSDAILIEPFTPIGPLITEWLWYYFGAYLVFDPNASGDGSTNDYGCWRMINPQRPDTDTGQYRYLAEFLMETPTPSSGMVSPTNPGAYPDVTYTQVTKRTFIRKGTLREWVVPAEANKVIVVGSGEPLANTAVSESNEKEKLVAIMYNKNSAKFPGESAPSPTHADYSDGRIVTLYYCNPSYDSVPMVQFAARRIYDMACHSQRRMSFEAPLVLVTNTDDTKQIRPRPLRFGDAVKVNGVAWLVDSVAIDYEGALGGSRFMHAAYELVQARTDLGGVGSQQNASDGLVMAP